jgi:hypothetical protein
MIRPPFSGLLLGLVLSLVFATNLHAQPLDKLLPPPMDEPQLVLNSNDTFIAMADLSQFRESSLSSAPQKVRESANSNIINPTWADTSPTLLQAAGGCANGACGVGRTMTRSTSVNITTQSSAAGGCGKAGLFSRLRSSHGGASANAGSCSTGRAGLFGGRTVLRIRH